MRRGVLHLRKGEWPTVKESVQRVQNRLGL